MASSSSFLNSVPDHDFDWQLKRGLRNNLNSIQVPGYFASFRPLSTQPFDEFVLLFAFENPAPWERIPDAVNTWLIDDDRAGFNFYQPEYDAFINNLILNVKNDLGIDQDIGIEADIRRLGIYGKDGVPKPHIEDRDVPRKFATLVLTLPSDHRGGDVKLTYGNRKVTFDSSRYDQSYACLYSDVNHAATPITSGFRCVIVYDLAVEYDMHLPRSALPRASAATEPSEMAALCVPQLLAGWLRDLYPSYLFHVLQYDLGELYDNPSALSMVALDTSGDLAQVQALLRLSNDLPFVVRLAGLERKRVLSGGFDWDWHMNGPVHRCSPPRGRRGTFERCSVTESMTFLVDMEGREKNKKHIMSFDRYYCLQCDPFANANVKEPDYDGFV
ncbi:hypothetical protein QBC38DRAFT_458227 [Podospora fimiseda]|uniref:Prolyl 4-hydroxylase alpha subunit Fe(2+) 2OG dioxygenase domain-containing protein n=1 Tax=Podospora fimiseda TaxID=252190 RepID=A0AAN7GXL8_9PEZI|nr:hypothetical protein QBC38DRAFT_458227 [Podospora fimiseda]